MIARIISNQWIYFDSITPWEEEQLVERFSAQSPNARYIDTTVYQSWDGVYRKYSRKHRRIARPFLAELRLFCIKSDLPLTVKDERAPSKYTLMPKDQVTKDLLPNITFKQFQVDGINKIYSAECGVFSITTGGGKTELMAAICKIIPCNTVIVAEQIVVIEQIKSRLELREVCEEAGLFYAGKTPTDQVIIVGSIQSLVTPKKPNKPTPDKYEDTKSSTAKQKYKSAMKRYESSLKAYKTRSKKAKILHKLIGACDMLLVDECDLAVGKTYQNLFRYWFKGRRRYGFTGTPYDDDKPVQKLVLQEHLGSVIYEQKLHDVEATGLIVPLEYYMIVVGEDGQKNDAMAYDIALDEFMVYNGEFHNMVAGICSRYSDDGTLILVERHDLGHALNDLIPDSQFVYGLTPKKQRAGMLREFEARSKKVLIGGKNVRRGLDLGGGCENLVLATGGKLTSEFDQRLGRARRRNEQGKARVFDFLFLCNKYLYAHSRKRLKAAVEMGYKTRVIFKDGVVDGADFVRSRFRKPKRFGADRCPRRSGAK